MAPNNETNRLERSKDLESKNIVDDFSLDFDFYEYFLYGK